MIDDYSERPTDNTEIDRRLETRTNLPENLVRHENVIDARPTYEEKKAVWRSYHIIWFFVGLITALLAFRFVFELLGANQYNPFVSFVYTLSYPLAGPFQTIFGITNVASATFDWSVLVAIVVYVLIGYALVKLLRIISPMHTDEVNHPVHTT